MVDVELAITGADGRPVASTDISIKVIDRPSFGSPVPDIAARTDSQGVARFQAPVGSYSMFVQAEAGYGSVGTTEFAPGRVARPQMARLASYGALDGTYETQYCRGDVVIHASGGARSQTLQDHPTAPGRFHLTRMGGGNWLIWVTADGQRCAETPLMVGIIPGRIASGVALSQLKPPPSQPAKPAAQPITMRIGGGSGKQAVWVKGTVRDESGKPVANASVMALATYYGGLRMYQRTAQAVTDANGYYEISGEGGLISFSATVLASLPGHAPAWAWPSFVQVVPRGTEIDIPEPPVQDLVIPSKSGTLNITVLRQGRPAAGVDVALYLENVNLRDIWARPESDASAIQDAAYPIAKTDEHGSAAFRNLLPGQYRVVASTETGATRAALSGFNQLTGLTVQSAGIPVRVGETTHHTLNLYEQQNSPRLQVMQPDGHPFVGTAAISYGPVDTIGWSSSLTFDSSGASHQKFDRAGLWKINFMYRDWPIDVFPIQEPYSIASGSLASSPNLAADYLSVFHSQRMEPGSVRLVVQDVDGKPCQVTINISNNNEGRWGTTDEKGQIVFHGLTTGQRYIIAILGSAQMDVDEGAVVVMRPVGAPATHFDLNASKEPPSPRDLIAEPAILPASFVAQHNTETRVEMRAVPRRYLYGTLRFPSEAGKGPWRVHLDPVIGPSGATVRNWATGEFVAGPFPPGDAQLFVISADQTRLRIPVHIDSTSIAAILFDIDVSKYKPEPVAPPPVPVPDPLAAAPVSTMLGMGGISSQAGGASQLHGKVFLSDGITPALGAQVLYWRPHQAAPSLFAMSDVLGNLAPRGLWRTAANPGNDNPHGPDAATAIAFLPGAAGAVVKTISRADDLAHLVLPPPISLTGRVTVGGASPLHRPGSILVIAAHQGGGFLDPYLTVSSTAAADGAFELAGLTPGDYQLQAALDNIWLSPPVHVTIGRTSPRPVTLAIPSPGVPVLLQLRDATGKPAAGVSVALDHTGPLAALWPNEWTSDPLGSISIPTLGAGRHTVRVTGASSPVRFEVPPLPAAPITVTINLK